MIIPTLRKPKPREVKELFLPTKNLLSGEETDIVALCKNRKAGWARDGFGEEGRLINRPPWAKAQNSKGHFLDGKKRLYPECCESYGK